MFADAQAHTLTRDFMAAGHRHNGDMAYLNHLIITPAGRPFLESIPVYRPRDWDGYHNTNCTSFAFNRLGQRIQPGFLGTGQTRTNNMRPEGLDAYAEDVHRSLRQDELPYLGDNLRDCVGKGVPAALFFQSVGDGEDYHWIALRRTFNESSQRYDRLIWADKLGSVVSHCGETSIFGKARLSRYEYFGGYYAIPAKILGTPEV
ncbi:MAG: hypothetical protein HYS17_09075 [Micavibrio aeruginosavorus]|uniref:Uncharacterized protein n=1 Tax=Micavibrio aeruginosavorus TaxID=349221 RepID=A0A7T5R181_9BACT|nr:MAG: hypothetical protein HYS17_09075 [Micavibrio aeruginosavorus]